MSVPRSNCVLPFFVVDVFADKFVHPLFPYMPKELEGFQVKNYWTLNISSFRSSATDI